MKHKFRFVCALFLYIAVIVCVAFYPGSTLFLTLYTMHPSIFTHDKAITFAPQPVPILEDAQKPFLSAQSYAVIDARTMTPIIQRNENVKRAPASLVKLAGALVALNTHSPTTVYTVKHTLSEPVVMGLVMGEKLPLMNLLYGSLINSANDAALTIADNYPGANDAFVEEMNAFAKKIGMTKSHFVNPIGFDSPNQYSTANDLAILGAYAMKQPLLRTITSTQNITVSDTSFSYFHPLTNINELVGTIPGVGGTKTGHTQEAQDNLMTYYLHDKKNPIIIVIMGSEDRFEDTRTLITYLNEKLHYSPFSSL